jgi:predicted RNA-binding protein
MPNWCSNEISVSGSQEVIAEILAIVEKNPEGFIMNDFVPMPKELEGTNAPQDKPNWYDWNISNWGTKWDICDGRMSVHPSKAGFSLGYETAWSPNCEFWTKFSELYPTVSIRHYYVEEGMQFIGETDYENGFADDCCVDISDEMYSKAGAVFDSEGYIDWDKSEVDLFVVFPLRRDKEMQNA